MWKALVLAVTAVTLGLLGTFSTAPSDAVELPPPNFVGCGGQFMAGNPPPKVHYSVACAARTNSKGMTHGAFAMKVNPATGDSLDDPIAALARVFAGIDDISSCSPPPPGQDCAVIGGTATVIEVDGTMHEAVPFEAEAVEGGPGVGALHIHFEESSLDGAPGDLTSGDANYDMNLDLSDGKLLIQSLFLGGPPPPG